MNRRLGNTLRSRRAAILIIALWVGFGLASLAVYSGHGMLLEYRAAQNTLAQRQAALAIDGALAYIKTYLSEYADAGRMPDLDDYEQEAVPVGDATWWLIGRPEVENTSAETPTYGLVDEASRLNLNTATFEMLEMLPEMTDELAAAIIDWRDEDSDVTENGAEEQTYLLEDPSYTCKDAPLETVDELRLVQGADLDLLEGEDFNGNGILETNEDDGDETLPEDNRDGRLDPGIFEYVTVYSREHNVQEDGSERINVGDQDTNALREALAEELGDSRAGEIVSRATPPPDGYTSTLQFYLQTEMTRNEFDQVADMLTFSDDEYLEGLVNVNTAPAAVLACIPGLDESTADQLVAWREGKDDEIDEISWITEVLEEEAALEAAPYLTTRSWQYSVDIAAVGDGGRGFQRVVFVLDTSEDPPIVIARRDRSSDGWPLGPEEREYASDPETMEDRDSILTSF